MKAGGTLRGDVIGNPRNLNLFNQIFAELDHRLLDM